MRVGQQRLLRCIGAVAAGMEVRRHLPAPGTCLRLAAPEGLLPGRCRACCPEIEHQHLRISSVAERDRLGFRQLQSVALHNSFKRVAPRSPALRISFMLTPKCIASKRRQLRGEFDRRKISETGLNHRLGRLKRHSVTLRRSLLIKINDR